MSSKVWACLLLAVLLLASGCRAPGHAPSRGKAHDDLGRPVEFAAPPLRLVSLAPSVTETLFALGFGDRLVAVTDFCEPPPGADEIPRIGGLVNPNLEAIRALQPDLLIGTTSGNDPSLEAQAAGLGLPLYTLHTPSVERMLASLVDLAGALGDRGKGETLAAEFRRRLAEVQGRVGGLPKPRVLFVIWGDPLIVPGSPAFLTDALRLAGGESVTADAVVAHPAFDLESAIARAPEVILTTRPNLDLADKLRSDPAWAGVPAVALERIYVVSEAVVRPGPGVVLGIEEMARHLHPGAFDAAEAE